MTAVEPRSRRGLVAVLTALAAGWTGTRLLNIAMPWFVLTSTGSATATGLVVFAQMGPYVLCQVLAGPLIDRIGPKRISVWGDVTAAVFLAAIPLAYQLDVLSLPVLMVLIALSGAAEGPANIAKSVFIPAAATAAGMRLERATGISGAIERTASTVGPAVAGVMVGAFGGPSVLWGTAALTALSGLIIAVGTVDPRREPDEDEDADAGYLTRLRGGVEFLRREKLLLMISGMITVTNLLDQGWSAVMLPLWAKESGYGPETVGLLFSVMSGASVAASLIAAAWGHRLPRRTVFLLGFIIGGVPRFILMAFGAPLWLIIGVFVIGGLGSGFLNPIIGAVQYERIPAAKLGRVTTLTRSMAWAGIPFGGLVASGFVALAGLSGAMLVVGGLYLAAILLPGLRPEWKQMKQAPVPKQREPEREKECVGSGGG
ncbi:MFS transporter [Stackebrandtia nassauensis]|uniref:Major facilitator superfamily MFS_1 n=1 Tax=Stackebrandtia nassauensis (strain DSM 44728 / CIP 108903 / NRRL B-16338 / NBRC 102104 / LLR-40K-21) TaxID=446470 RepID=D3PU86_STANL|nr:MFS transporter [Stackebrandtia nassauensis]ADD41032.1 major facilitator superfamily MFS_1 [Stackebrandtia nassauensis DSM 44728]